MKSNSLFHVYTSVITLRIAITNIVNKIKILEIEEYFEILWLIFEFELMLFCIIDCYFLLFMYLFYFIGETVWLTL